MFCIWWKGFLMSNLSLIGGRRSFLRRWTATAAATSTSQSSSLFGTPTPSTDACRRVGVPPIWILPSRLISWAWHSSPLRHALLLYQSMCIAAQTLEPPFCLLIEGFPSPSRLSSSPRRCSSIQSPSLLLLPTLCQDTYCLMQMQCTAALLGQCWP